MAENLHNRNRNIVHNNHIISEPSTSSSNSTLSSSSNHLSVTQADSAVMIPLSAENLESLRASGIQFTSLCNTNPPVSGGNIIRTNGNFNLGFGNANVILNNPVDSSDGGGGGVILEAVSLGDHQQQQLLQLQQSHVNATRANSTNNNRAIMHSSDLADSQSLGNSHIINMNNGENMHMSDASNSATGLMQALGAAVSRAVASGNFSTLLTSSMNVPISINQNGIINGNEIMTFNSVPTSIINGASAQLVLNQQQQQQLVLNQLENNMMNSVPSISLHHGAVSNGLSVSRAGNSITTSSASSSSNAMVTVSMGQQHHQHHQQQQLWVQPDQSGFLPAAVTLSSQELALQGQLTLPTSSQDNSSLQELQQSHIDGNQYQDLGTQFPGVFQVQQQANGINTTYQSAAHSTYRRNSPVQEYRNIGDDSEATPSFSNSQHLSSDNQAAQLIAAPSVDSSTLQQGFQLVFDAENRVLTVQRVMSPSDCTVSQSTLSFDNSEAQATLLPMTSQSGQSYTMVQVSSMPNSFGSGSSTSEVSTSSMAAMLGVQDNRNGLGVNSSDDGLSSSSYGHSVMAVSKMELKSELDGASRLKSELDGATECDTTQADIEFHNQRSPAYMEVSNNIDDEPSLDSTTIHSTMQGSAGSDVIMDSTLDSSDLANLHSGMNNSDLATLHPVTLNMSRDIMHAQQGNQASCSSSVDESRPGPSGLQFSSRKRHSVESMPQPSKAMGFLRKSKRLELVEQEPKASQRKKDYQSQQYDLNMLWCEDCMQAYKDECPTHRVTCIQDKVVMTRAWASLPNQVHIFRVTEAQMGPEDSEFGVQAKRQIPKFTQFGPFVADLVPSPELVTRKSFPLMVEQEDGGCMYFETADEDKCNWMMFVRPARTFAEQNLVAYQYKEHVYFTVTKLIESKQELKVWYAAHYAERIGVKTLELTEEDMQALDEEDARFGCFECSRKFKSSAALQQHLTTHEIEDMRDYDDGGDIDFFAGNQDSGAKGKQKGSVVRGKLLQGKGRRANGENGSYHWKKKSTSLYLNKTLKKYKKRQCSEKTLISMKSMYKKQGKVSGGSEWMCTHCDLTFDNASLLNLHTLTHAAEDLGMDELRKLAEEQSSEVNQMVSSFQDGCQEVDGSTLANMITIDRKIWTCPKCSIGFEDHKNLMNHVATHAQVVKIEKPFDCNSCSKSFSTQEKLLKHSMVHGDEADKPLQCPVCYKRVMNNSAMACHMKIHSGKRYYDCPVCNEDFDMVANLREHSLKHMDGQGLYPCNTCTKIFEDFTMLKKHIKGFHSDRVFACPDCGKIFPRADKFRLHMLRHTTHREFMCETCGRQFKRKDKLKEHMKRMHSKERLEQLLYAKQQHNQKQSNKFTPKVMPSEYHRFIYKCHTCLLGFKRRGMLVNHLAKRHPEIKPEHVPELNLPILKTQKDFYCQYCEKIYKSSSKRKSHIQKNHPGCPIPPSSRKKVIQQDVTNISFSHTVSSVTTMPHGCKFCHKQYASKAKLLQHQRKNHAALVEPAQERRKPKKQPDFLITVGDPSQGLERYEAVPIAVVNQGDNVGNADLLTQAMSELHNYANEFMSNPRLNTGGAPTMVHIQSNGQLQPTTIDINQLNQALHSFTSQTGGVATVLAQPPQPTSPNQAVTVVAPIGSQTINLGNAQFITRAWAGSFATTFR